MKENQVYVESCTDGTVVLDVPEYHIKRVWPRRGAKFPFDREIVEELMYNEAFAGLIHGNYLKCEDKEFMQNADLLKADNTTPKILELTEPLMKRLIGVMPIAEFKDTLVQLMPNQIQDLVDYAIEHNDELKMDKADILGKMTGKNILRAIEYAKADQEG